jgi:ubiquinone biosynthesis protein
MLLQFLVLAIVDGDATKIIHGLERAEVLDDDTDMVELTRDMEELLSSYANLPIKDIPFREALTRVFDIIRLHHIVPPRDFTLMLKSLMTIESFATALDGDFQIIDRLKPYARKFSLEEISPQRLFRQMQTAARSAGDLATRLPEDASAIITKYRRGRFKIHIHHDHLEELEQTLDNSSNRIAFSVIIAALLVGSSLLVPQDGTVLGLISLQALGIVGYLTATAIGIWLVISIIRSRRY